MSLQEIKKLKSEKGFTIVELLIVIVVIGILAAIVIVAYQGVTARANTQKNNTTAVSIQKKAEAFNADTAGTSGTQSGNGYYPATAAVFNAIPSPYIGQLPNGVTVGAALPTSTTQTAMLYRSCATTAGGSDAQGFYIGYWDYTANAVKYIVGGNETAASAATDACTTGVKSST